MTTALIAAARLALDALDRVGANDDLWFRLPPDVRRDLQDHFGTLRAALDAKEEPVASALVRYKECTAEDPIADPIEALRFFCSMAMSGQDWLDVEPFFDAFASPPPAREPIEGCLWAVTKGGHTICQPPKRWAQWSPASDQQVPDVARIMALAERFACYYADASISPTLERSRASVNASAALESAVRALVHQVQVNYDVWQSAERACDALRPDAERYRWMGIKSRT